MKKGQVATYINEFFMKYWMLLFMATLLVACSEYTDIRAYYYPLKDLEEGMVYEYQSISAQNFPNSYWYYRSFISEDSVYMTGTNYGRRLFPEQFFRDKMVDNGMLTEAAFMYETDSTERQLQIPVEIKSGHAFPFQVKKEGGVFLHQLAWESELDSTLAYEIVKNRKYAGKTTYEYKGKKYPAVKFSVKEAIDQEQDGVLTLEAEGEEIYAKDIGLVYFKKDFGEGVIMEFELKDRYDMEKLEEKFLQLHKGHNHGPALR